MIESVYKKIHPATGIIYILVNTKDRWMDYQVNNVLKSNKLSITFNVSKDIEVMPGEWEGWEGQEVEFIDMPEGFEPFKYVIYHQQNKDQITLVLIPKELMLNKQEWVEL